MTLEAAVILPCFLFFFINLSSSLEMIRLYGNIQYALHSAGDETCLYGALLTDEMKDLGSTGHVSASGDPDSSENLSVSEDPGDPSAGGEENADPASLIRGSALSYTYIKYRMVESLGEEYLASSPLRNGSMSLDFLGSSFGETNDIVDIRLSYAVCTPLNLMGTDAFYLSGRYYGHLWNGYEVHGSSTEPVQEQIVYITADSEVYHITTACTHLRLTIRGVEYGNLQDERNRSGGRYYPCEVCSHGDVPDIVYVGAEGDRYHFDPDCYTLTRTYSAVPLSDVSDSHRPCSRCGGG
ncbi:MAG: hypothetical protein K5871_03160 [Lachnospiraceae bacterium]|nr:hypothetical protein [Lachnospiraceae bacterium]